MLRGNTSSQAQFFAEKQTGASFDFNKKDRLSDKERESMMRLFKDAYIKSKGM